MASTVLRKIQESDLSLPVQAWLESQGYRVSGEVKHCDLIARKNDEIIAIELKLGFSLTLVYQGLRRQEHCDKVYLAVGLCNGKKSIPRMNDVRRLCARLKLGLLLVHFHKDKTKVQLTCRPDEVKVRNRPSKRAAIVKELDGRYAEFTSGGLPSTVSKMSAYRQRALRIASLLEHFEHGSSPARLIEQGADSRAGLILRSNYYNWFEHKARGLYSLSTQGKQALLDYAHELEVIKQSLL